MKTFFLIALMALGMSASAQTTTVTFFIDTITDDNGVIYTNTFDEISIYHESDDLLYESDSDLSGRYCTVYYNATGVEPVVYVYYMAEELCYKMVTYTGHQVVRVGSMTVRL